MFFLCLDMHIIEIMNSIVASSVHKIREIKLMKWTWCGYNNISLNVLWIVQRELPTPRTMDLVLRSTSFRTNSRIWCSIFTFMTLAHPGLILEGSILTISNRKFTKKNVWSFSTNVKTRKRDAYKLKLWKA